MDYIYIYVLEYFIDKRLWNFFEILFELVNSREF